MPIRIGIVLLLVWTPAFAADWREGELPKELDGAAVRRLARQKVVLGGPVGTHDLPVFVTSDALLAEFHQVFADAMARHEKDRDGRLREALRFVKRGIPRATLDWKLPEKITAAAVRRAKAEIDAALAMPAGKLYESLRTKIFRIDDDEEFLAILVLRRSLYANRDREGRVRTKATLKVPAKLYGAGTDPAVATGPSRWIYPFDEKALAEVRAVWRERSKTARILPMARPPHEAFASKLEGETRGLDIATALGSGYARGYRSRYRRIHIDRARPCFGGDGFYGEYFRCLGALFKNPERSLGWQAKGCRTVIASWEWMRARKPVAGQLVKVRIGFVEPVPVFFERLAGLAEETAKVLPDERWKGLAGRARQLAGGTAPAEMKLLTGVPGMRRLYVLRSGGDGETLCIGAALPGRETPTPDWLDALELLLPAEGAPK